MPSCEVLINGKTVCYAGGADCTFLSADLGGGRMGPVGLTVHGLLEKDDANDLDHVWWANKNLNNNDEVIFVLSDRLDSSTWHKVIDESPQIVERLDLSLEVRINGEQVSVATIGNLDNVGMSLRWSKKHTQCDFRVMGSSNLEDGPSKLWLERKLTIGDKVAIRVSGGAPRSSS